MTTATSRRAVLAGAATLPALSMPAVAGGWTAPSSADSELIELGRTLAASRAAYDAALTKVNAIGDRAAELAEERTGFKFPELEDRAKVPEKMKKLWDAMFATQKELGFDAADKGLAAQSGKVDAIIQRINDLPASTVGGLGAKAVAAAFNNEDLWDEAAADLDIGRSEIRDLIDCALAAAGIDNPVASEIAES